MGKKRKNFFSLFQKTIEFFFSDVDGPPSPESIFLTQILSGYELLTHTHKCEILGYARILYFKIPYSSLQRFSSACYIAN